MKHFAIVICAMFSLSFVVSIYAFTHYRTHDYYFDSQRNYVNYSMTESGVDVKEAEWFIQTYRYNVTDSGGKTHTLVVGRHIWARVNGKWKWQTGWWKEYDEVQKWLDKHTSN